MLLRAAPTDTDLLGSNGAGLSKSQIEKIVHDYIVKNPEVLTEAMSAMQDRDDAARQGKQRAAVETNKDAVFKSATDHIGGNPDGDVTVVEFLDYRCGYCKKARPEVLKMIADDKKIRLIVKEFPILGPDSELASRAAIASAGDTDCRSPGRPR